MGEDTGSPKGRTKSPWFLGDYVHFRSFLAYHVPPLLYFHMYSSKIFWNRAPPTAAANLLLWDIFSQVKLKPHRSTCSDRSLEQPGPAMLCFDHQAAASLEQTPADYHRRQPEQSSLKWSAFLNCSIYVGAVSDLVVTMQDTQSRVGNQRAKDKYWQASSSSSSSPSSSSSSIHTPSIRCCPETTKPWVKEPGSTTCFVQPSFENGWRISPELCPKKGGEHLPFRNTPQKTCKLFWNPKKHGRVLGLGFIFLCSKAWWL